ncbi:hypothetical protein [Nannocystis sp.]|uniref:hypothetical protein n=1 Tax=Nannocystis sp. TaxID=1962667 RepID=UPI0025DC9FF4|nr:hypothetical protein [Nannocystis sp.]MBK7825855.1 hypothetical protein [Nannocystis sp.]
MAELEWLRRNLVGPGLLPASRLDAWLVGWTPERPLLRHLVELGVLDAAGVGTISAAIKGYLRIESAALVGLFRGVGLDGAGERAEVSRDPAASGGESPSVRRDRPAVAVSADRPAVPGDRPAVAVPGDRPDVPGDRSVVAVPGDMSAVPGDRLSVAGDTDRPGVDTAEEEKQGGADRSQLGLRWTGSPGASAAHSSRVRAAVDAALSPSPGLPPPPERLAAMGLPAAGESVAGYRLLMRLRGGEVTAMYRALGGAGPVLLKLRRDDGELAVQAAAYARLVHPAIVPLVASGAAQGLAFLAFADLGGVGLEEFVAGSGPLSTRRVAQIGLAAAEALAAAAAAGVLHGELGLDRIFVARADARVTIVDFAAPTEAAGRAVHRAPERAQGGPASVAGDMFSLGVALYTALTGRPPPPRVAESGLSSERGLASLIARLLRAQADSRPRGWGEVVAALREQAGEGRR